jgi:hypothetical protein
MSDQETLSTGFSEKELPKGEMSYPSMDGEGYEPIELPREKQYKTEADPGIDRMLLREAPLFLRDRLTEAIQAGRLSFSLDHYEKIINANSDVFNSRLLASLKTLFAEGRQAANGRKEAREQWTKKLDTFAKGIRMAKRGK